VRALITFEAANPEGFGVRHQAPTLIGCLFVKELAQPALPFCAAASSAAEKRDYEELSTFRQQVFCFAVVANFAPTAALLTPQPVPPERFVLRGGES
jgi:hypothetical protein